MSKLLQDSAGVADDGGAIRDIVDDNGAGSDGAPLANGEALNNTGPNTNMSPLNYGDIARQGCIGGNMKIILMRSYSIRFSGIRYRGKKEVSSLKISS